MAIRLDIPVQPIWIQIRPGIMFHVKPLTALVDGVVRGEAYAEAERMGEAYRAARAAGQLRDDALDIETPEAHSAVGELVYAKVMARHALLDWSGIVMGEAGEKAALTRANIDAVMEMYGMPQDFLLAYTGGMAALQSEKKSSGPGQNGTSAASGPTIAETAAASAPSAQNA